MTYAQEIINMTDAQEIAESWLNGQKKQAVQQLIDAKGTTLTVRDVMGGVLEYLNQAQGMALLTFYADYKWQGKGEAS